jgi:protein-disulfide isomerase
MRAASLALAASLVAALSSAACSPEESARGGGAELRIDGQRHRVALFDDDLALGGAAPLVTIVAFSDYGCPPCATNWKALENLAEDWGEDVRVVYRGMTVPGYGQGERAAEAAFAAARQGKFWEMHQRLFAAPGDYSRATLRAHAEAVGLDVPKFLDDVDTGAEAGRRIRHRRQAIELGVAGLPVTFVNGLPVIGAHPEAMWHDLVKAEANAAREMIAAGTPRTALYAELMKTASTRPIGETAEMKALRQGARPDAKPAPGPVVRPDGNLRYDVRAGARPVLGPPNAPVLIVEFSDLQCPYCRKLWTDTMQPLLERHGDDIAVALRHLPLEIHTSAEGMAKAVAAAQRQGKAWEMHARLIAWQGPAGQREFELVADELGLDRAKFLADFASAEVSAEVAEDLGLARRLGVTGTPGLFINGRYFNGYQSIDTLDAVVLSELDKARELEGKGIARANVVDALLGEAVKEPQFPNP